MQVHIETEINAPAEKVWQILAHQFADMAEWTQTLSESRVVDASEIPAGIVPAASAPVSARETTSSFAKAVEVITDYSEEERMLKFEAVNLPAVLSAARNTQRVVARGDNKSAVSFDLDLQLRGIFKIIGPLMRRRFQSTFSDVQQELKVYAETGQVAF